MQFFIIIIFFDNFLYHSKIFSLFSKIVFRTAVCPCSCPDNLETTTFCALDISNFSNVFLNRNTSDFNLFSYYMFPNVIGSSLLLINFLLLF